MCSTTTELDSLRAIIGAEGVRRILECALPYLEQSRQQLRQQLQAGDWAQAAATAHRVKGTAHLYGDEALLSCLTKIHANHVTHAKTDELIAQTDHQMASAIATIKQILSAG